MLKLIQSKDELINKIEQLMVDTRGNVITTINYTLLVTYMEIRKILVEFYRNASFDTNKSITEISKILKKIGKVFSRTNIWNMINFYKEYKSVQTLSERLSWSYYCELLIITDVNKRKFYEKECINSKWSVRELRRQIDSSLYERLLLSNGEANKEKVLENVI